MSARFFIERPVLAGVLSIIIVLAGLAAARVLPIAQYSQIVPSQVVVSTTYSGADADTVAQTVADPLERAINGVERLIYMQSVNTDGAMTLTLSFETGTDPDQATINVSNRVQGVLATLPAEVQRVGVTISKQSSAFLAIVSLAATDGRFDETFLSNYALRNVIDEIKRIPGVGNASLFGQKEYAMRIWLHPEKLAQFSLTASDVSAAIREQNQQFAAGQINASPSAGGGAYTYAMTAQGRLPDAAAFGNIILQARPDGSTLRLHDVARVELGAQQYDFTGTLNGRPSAPFGIYLQPGANALRTMTAVTARLDELAAAMPQGMAYSIPYDTTTFVKVSIKQVIHTFVEAIMLVVVVVFLFLDLLSYAPSTSAGAAFVDLRDWSERRAPEQDARLLANGLSGALAAVRDAYVLAFNPPAIDGLGTVGGFEMKILDRAGAGREAMTAAVQALVQAAARRPGLAGVSTTLQSNVPRYRLDIDRDAAKARGVALSALFETVQSTFSSLYVNDFSLLGRNYRVNLQSDAEYRRSPEDLSHVFVRAANGEMVPASAMLTLTRVVGGDLAERFDGFPAATVNGAAAPGYSSGQALVAMRSAAPGTCMDNAVAATEWPCSTAPAPGKRM